MKTVQLHELQCQIVELSHVIGAAYETLMDMEFGSGPNRNVRLDRVASLTSVAHAIAERAVADFDKLEVGPRAPVEGSIAINDELNLGREILALREKFNRAVAEETSR